MKRFLFICLFLSLRSFGMEEGVSPYDNCLAPVPVHPIPITRNWQQLLMREEKEEVLPDLLLKLARAAYSADVEGAVVCMEEVQRKIDEEKPTNLLFLLKRQAVYTHVTTLLKRVGLVSEPEAQLFGKFGTLLLVAAGEDTAALQDGLCFVQRAIASGKLSNESKKEARKTKGDFYKRLAIKRGKKKKKSKKEDMSEKCEVRSDEEVGDVRSDLALRSAEVVQPVRFLTTERPLFPGRRLPTDGIAGSLAKQSIVFVAEGECVGAKDKKKKKKKTKRKKKGKGSSLDMSQFTGSWDQTLMYFLGKKYKSREQAMAYLTGLDACFEVSDPRREVLFGRLRDAVSLHNDQPQEKVEQLEGLLLDQQQDCYVLGRLLLENATSDIEKSRPFALIKAAAESHYLPAQMYLAESEKTGLTKRKRILYLIDVFNKKMGKRMRERVFDIAKKYKDEGYFSPLLVCAARAGELGNLETYFDELEKEFPPIRIYDIDEQLISKIDLGKSFDSERWSAQALRCAMNIIDSVWVIESPHSHSTAKEEQLRKMRGELDRLDDLFKDHKELSTLRISCHSLLGRAYGECGKGGEAFGEHEQAIVDVDPHETMLVNYIGYLLNSKSNIVLGRIAKKNIESIDSRIGTLIKGAVNYKSLAFLLYAVFCARRNNMSKAECFAKKAAEQMKREHSEDMREGDFYKEVQREIKEQKDPRNKRTVESIKKEKEQLRGKVHEGLVDAHRAIELADQQAEKYPLKALIGLQEAECDQDMFGMLNLDDALRTRYDGVIEKIKTAKNRLTNETQRYMDEILQELNKKQKQADGRCMTDPDNNSIQVVRLKESNRA